MDMLRKFLTLGLCIGLAAFVTACDVDDDEEGGDTDAGAGGSGGAGGDMGGGGMGGDMPMGGQTGSQADVLDWVCITDTSMVENDNGTPGIDICGVFADCGEGPTTGINSAVESGTGVVCTGDAQMGCGAARNDASAAEDDGMACVADSDPSDYVSTGVGGTLCVQFNGDLQGCSISVVEYSGSDEESYTVKLCDNGDGSGACSDEFGSATESGASAGVTETFEAPEAEDGEGAGGAGGSEG